MAAGTTSLTGAAGEHLVMSRLLSRGMIAALAPDGVPNLDIVVTSLDGNNLCSLQVKTSWDKGANRGWHMAQKHEGLIHDRMFYCFVDLGPNADHPARVYVVPSATVAHLLTIDHQTWLKTPGKMGQQRKDSTFRRLRIDHSDVLGPNSEFGAGWLEPYLETWETLLET